MVFPKGFGYGHLSFGIKLVQVTLDKLFKTAAEISQKQFIVLRGKQRKDVVIVFVQMSEQVQKYRAFSGT